MTAPATELPVQIIKETAQWLMRIRAGEMDAAAEAAWQQWRQQSPLHEQAWQKAERLGQHFDAVPPAIGKPILGRPRQRNRRALLQTLALLLCAPSGAWLAWREWRGDYHTATGERRTIHLPDGGRLTLNTASAVDLIFDGTMRQIVLQRGEILLQTAHATAWHDQPLSVKTRFGQVVPTGTRFTVHDRGDVVAVTVSQGRVELRPNDSQRTLTVHAGEAAGLDATAAFMHPSQQSTEHHPESWAEGLLHAHDQRLADFIAELARYRPGWLRCDPAVAELRISGVFRTEDTDAALAIIAETLPVSIHYRTPYWVSLTAQDQG